MKKGFTLIELLAVIIVLSVIALIATPVVLNVVENAKKSANKNSAYGIIDSAKLYYAESLLDSSKQNDINGATNVLDKINISGSKPDSGVVYINNKGETALAVVYDKVCYIKKFNESDLAESEDIENCKLDIEETPLQPEVSYKCKRATVLHTEECTQTSTTTYCSGAGYTETGSKKTTTITYGNLGTKGTLTSGDAFDCDVDGDGNYGEYDETTGKYTERFYYVSDYYNTVTKSFEKDKAVLVYYNGISTDSDGNVIPSNTSSANYDWTGIGVAQSYKGPLKAINRLPKTSDWSNVHLFNEKRNILTYNGTIKVTDFDYSLYAARILTLKELGSACGFSAGTIRTGQLDKCIYVLENTKYASGEAKLIGIWLENPVDSSSDAWDIRTPERNVVKTTANAGYIGVRPVIEVLKTDIEI